jgi:hypothetical protein
MSELLTGFVVGVLLLPRKRRQAAEGDFMKLSLAEAATALGKSERQVRYLIKTGRLSAAKQGGQWAIDSADLPLTEAQRQRLAERLRGAREAFDKGLDPATKAVAAGDARRQFSVTDLAAFRVAMDIYRDLKKDLGKEDPACLHLGAALVQMACGCHSFQPTDKVGRFTAARELAATAVAELLLAAEEGDRPGRSLAERLEQELIPKLGGLVAAYEKKNRRSRFDQVGSAFRSARAR